MRTTRLVLPAIVLVTVGGCCSLTDTLSDLPLVGRLFGPGPGEVMAADETFVESAPFVVAPGVTETHGNPPPELGPPARVVPNAQPMARPTPYNPSTR